MTKTYTSTEIIANRDLTTDEINKTWNIISVYNVIDKGYVCNYDIKLCYEKIKKLNQDRTNFKIYSMATNLGYTNFDDFPTASLYSYIFELYEVTNMIAKLTTIKTINPVLKIKKGKASLKKSETLTSAFIKKEIDKLSKRQLELKFLLNSENDKRTFTVTTNTISMMPTMNVAA